MKGDTEGVWRILAAAICVQGGKRQQEGCGRRVGRDVWRILVEAMGVQGYKKQQEGCGRCTGTGVWRILLAAIGVQGVKAARGVREVHRKGCVAHPSGNSRCSGWENAASRGKRCT